MSPMRIDLKKKQLIKNIFPIFIDSPSGNVHRLLLLNNLEQAENLWKHLLFFLN